MNKGTIYMPNHFSKDKIKFVLRFIEKQIVKYPIIYGDHILVDEINGDINIKVIKCEEIEKLCKENKLSEYEIVMGFMRLQDRPGRVKTN